MNRVIIELEFDDKPTDADVYNYLNELMDNDCLGYRIKENEWMEFFILILGILLYVLDSTQEEDKDE